ncbi:MAG TPA: alpha/beta fold hydrolase [Dehalococcoidia bacterium]|nr:alpha/beta fold hydrolase [Dehalococcoidia bacterium]
MNAPPVQYVTTSDSYSIAYAVSGQGRPLVILPGSFEHVQLAWQYPKLQPWLEGLTARFQLIQFDERGCGMSTRGLKDDHAVEHYQRDLEAVVDHLNPDPFVLFAAATGVATAVQFTLNHPDRVFALILGAARLSQVSSATQSAFFNTLPEADWEIFLLSLASQYQAPEDVPRSVALLSQAFEKQDFAQRMRVALLGLPEESLSRLRTPTLILYPRDYWGSEETSSMRAAQLARATFTLIDGSFAMGDADQGIRAIESFLADLPNRAPDGGLPPQTTLSTRELEVLRLLAAGRSNQQIADELVISLNTVNRHASNIYAKTGAANRAQATAYAKDQGIA